MEKDKVFRLSPVASFQKLGDGAVILLTDSGQIFSCNEPTDSFLQKVDGARTIDEVVDMIALEYDISRETLFSDMAELATDLEKEGIIVCERE